MGWIACARTGVAPAVQEVALTVSELERPTALLLELGGRVVESREVLEDGGVLARVVRVQFGQEVVALVDWVGEPGRPWRAGAASQDLAFQHLALVTRDIDAAYAAVASNVVPVSAGIQRIPDTNPVAGGIRAVYFRTPEGDPLELISYPPGRGNPLWQEAAGAAPVIGIDHTAIVVADTARSRTFYTALGFRLVGESTNVGVEQEHLSGVRGAQVRISGFAGGAGAGIELLAYEAPGGGVPAPSDARPSDLWHAETVVLVADLNAAVRAALTHGGAEVGTTGPCGWCADPAAASVTVADPDGHWLRLVQR